ncbi:hypothetical protein F5Y18DRAFT_425315 [Xylariaceae sp. FL1019]|nr:hypothetical protein F5Y18DRAFT_425315 [Xylariaceae sp. FL1019]
MPPMATTQRPGGHPGSRSTVQQRQRNDAQSSRSNHDTQSFTPSTESWVEVSSQPSSSSVSSIGDDIVTTGLNVGSSYRPRRRRLHPHSYPQNVTTNQATAAANASSQDEYEESESEEDHLLNSSTENLVSGQSNQTPLRQVFSAQVAMDNSSDEDDDENATALGRRPSEPFRPQPNVFSHPPSHLQHRHSTSSAIPHRRPSFSRRSHTRVDPHSPNLMSPNYQADNDAALRASLTTLLSCAAAARSRPRDGDKEKVEDRTAPARGGQPVELRLVPERELMAPSPTQATPAAPALSRGSTKTGTSSSSSAPQAAAGEKIKRSATPTSGSKSPRATKKKRTATASEDAFISPTLMTWVFSAGVVVLVSVVGFGAGYVIGREAGRQETLSGLASGNTSCGGEVIRSGGGSLRRFRFGSGMGRSVVAA